MSDNTVYLITGANRGKYRQHLACSYPSTQLITPSPDFPLATSLPLAPHSHRHPQQSTPSLISPSGIGLALATLLLTRPHTTVLATSRRASPSLTTAFPSTKIQPTSSLLPFLLDEADPAISSATLAARLQAEHGITALDVVVANAGGTVGRLRGVLDTDPETQMMKDFEVNAVGPAKLFRAVWPLLEGGGGKAAAADQKKFVLITSSIGSIATLDVENMPGVAYGMSKAAANWWAKKVSVELKGRLVVGIIHPG